MSVIIAQNLAMLARQPVDVGLGREELDLLADLTRRRMQETVRAKGGVLTPDLARNYTECSEVERDAMRSGVVHVLVALVLLDIVDQPH